ncbi:MAG: nitroreductase family protein [Bdellovibrionales bacterium]
MDLREPKYSEDSGESNDLKNIDFQTLIRGRRTVHNYRPETVRSELVEEALELSLWAPNHKLSFPWVYTWVGRETRSQLADLAVELKSQSGPLGEAKFKAVRENVINPAHLISLGLKRDSGGGAEDGARERRELREHEDYATLACSVQIISLYLWQNGVASKWSTGAFSTHPRTYRILGLDPDKVKLEGCLLVGYALNVPAPPPRPELSACLRRVP